MPGGGYAEYCIAPASHCLPVPDGISATDAAGIWNEFHGLANVFQRAYLQKGDVSSCTADRAASAQQRFNSPKRLARVLTAGSREKCDACEALGADLAINYKEEDWVAVLREKTEKQGVTSSSIWLAAHIQKNIDSLNWDGRLSIIAF